MTSASHASVVALGIVLATSTIGFTQAPPNPESIQKGEQVLADARKALGGDKLAQVKSLVASGRTKRIRGNNLVPIEFEMLIELPDKYVRIDEFPAENTDPTSTGFNGDNLIQIPPPQEMAAGRGTAAGAAPPAPAGLPAAESRAAPPAGATPSAAATPPSAATPGLVPPGAIISRCRQPVRLLTSVGLTNPLREPQSGSIAPAEKYER